MLIKCFQGVIRYILEFVKLSKKNENICYVYNQVSYIMNCSSCGSNTHQRKTHKSCPYNKKYLNQINEKKSIITECDIDLIDKKAKGRENNDSLNKKRENIFLVLVNLSNTQINTKYSGEKWSLYSNQVSDIIHNIIGNEIETFDIKKIAGLKNYDFDIICANGKIHHIEYKHNARKIEDLPQILQINCFTNNTKSNRHLIEFSYIEYYYQKLNDFLPELKKIAKETIQDNKNIKLEFINMKEIDNFDIISKENYLENVKNFDKKNRHVFFNQLKELKYLCQNEEFDTFVENTIKDFLYLYGKGLNITNFKNLMIETQNKYYILFSCNDKKYYYDKLELFYDTIFSIDKITENTIYVKTNNNIQFSILLRWKNGKGILKPAFQIKAQRFTL